MPELSTSRVPAIRVRVANDKKVSSDAGFVLYWMTAFRRTTWNFSLQRAIGWAQHLAKPLVILEALRCDYPWASDRFHAFVIQGMVDNAASLKNKPVCYYPFLESKIGEGKGLLLQLARDAAVVVTDEFPCFFLPRMIARAAESMPVRLDVVDSNGLLPLRAADKVFARAFDFRRFLQKNLLPHLQVAPAADPWEDVTLPLLPELPAEIVRRWPAAALNDWVQCTKWQQLPINHEVGISPFSGGTRAAHARLQAFLTEGLPDYLDARNEPERQVTSGLSPYLHFGHISAHEVFHATASQDDWNFGRVAEKVTGAREGWWGASAEVESFWDELITWREVGFNMCWHSADFDKYESLPDWAQTTLDQHRRDPRAFLYSLDEFESARTHDQLWNAAQRQLVREGRMHNYLRMLWGKKILEWTQSPEEALDVMIELNNKYALDGRNPNSYSGIFWVLGRYDRAWGPERDVYGKIRYMSSANTARKVGVDRYLQLYGE